MFWFNFLLLFLLVAGHTELLVTLVNRLHARPVRSEILRRFRHLHDVLIPVFPIVLLWFMGTRGHELLAGGTWSNVPVGWRVYLGLCGLGTAGLAYSVIRWSFRRLPAAQISNHSRVVNVEERLGHRPVADGPFRYLTGFPGNEIFQVEVSEKIYRLPRLPRSWDGLSILHLTDLHFIGTLDRSFFEHVAELSAGQEADLIVFTGDLLDRQRFSEWLPTTLGRLSAPLGCYFVLGNHDWYLDAEQIRSQLAELGWQDVAGKTTTLDHKGHPLVIGGTELPWMGTHPDFSLAPADAFRLLLSHTPDHLPWARRQCVDLMLAGHNHGGQVVLPVIGPVYSPSRHGVRYFSGAFWEEPTLLYVSRGISGRHPLRLNCRPELTKLVLRIED